MANAMTGNGSQDTRQLVAAPLPHVRCVQLALACYSTRDRGHLLSHPLVLAANDTRATDGAPGSTGVGSATTAYAR